MTFMNYCWPVLNVMKMIVTAVRRLCMANVFSYVAFDPFFEIVLRKLQFSASSPTTFFFD